MNMHMVVNVSPEPFGQEKCFELKSVSNKSNAYHRVLSVQVLPHRPDVAGIACKSAVHKEALAAPHPDCCKTGLRPLRQRDGSLSSPFALLLERRNTCTTHQQPSAWSALPLHDAEFSSVPSVHVSPQLGVTFLVCASPSTGTPSLLPWPIPLGVLPYQTVLAVLLLGNRVSTG